MATRSFTRHLLEVWMLIGNDKFSHASTLTY